MGGAARHRDDEENVLSLRGNRRGNSQRSTSLSIRGTVTLTVATPSTLAINVKELHVARDIMIISCIYNNIIIYQLQ